MRWLVGLVVMTACSFPHGAAGHTDADVRDPDAPDPDGDAQLDALVDAMPDAATNVCSTAGLTCVNGSKVALMCNGACWIKCQTTAAVPDQPTASAACDQWGGKLAPIRDINDEACVATTLFPAQASWIGFEQDAAATTLAGGWSWNSDGQPVTYTNWSGGQPDDANGNENGTEQCAYMPTTGTWQDTPCSGNGLFRFSCRKDLN